MTERRLGEWLNNELEWRGLQSVENYDLLCRRSEGLWIQKLQVEQTLKGKKQGTFSWERGVINSGQ
jgi:hypothetical protein